MTQPQRVLVTGASGRIGRAIALRLARDGFHVTAHARTRAAEAEALAAEILGAGGSADVTVFDVTDREAARSALEALVEAHGPYYGIVCNAGITRDNAFPALSEEDWDLVLRTSLDGFFNVVHPLTMPMIRLRKGGRIVCIASVSGVIGNRGQVNYSAAKAGLIGAAKALAVELAGRAITVNCIAPGLIASEMLEEVDLGHALAVVPMKRVGQPEDVADLAGFLFSPSAGYITRQVIGVNGGMI
ncbi:3-oxoacyl-ACP reductase FabG [Mesoterricola silvestris]|uniref:Beta-ketoacyl-ACP reductase n=1 Tax=Mesoterricola silvestris TaxID=2927979 RepID=A0AA48GNU8_9BACT|nr:3-oxoacyl-ACP reductase FabG [Mesoterricola silvestris]BDU71445.1 beta-ketoacyl-ACP reductase [Mesoterricola silvestris]